MKRIAVSALVLAAALPAALAEEGTRVAGSRLPNILIGVGAIALGVFLFVGMLAGRQKREVVVTSTGLPIPMPLIPLAMGLLVGIYLIATPPPDSYVLNGVRYHLDEKSAAAVGFAKGAEAPEILNLPDTVDGMPLTRVEGFRGSGVREVNLPGSVTEISKGAFEDCASLESVRIVGASSQALVIAQNAFRKCAMLKTLEGFNHIGEIRAYAFENCTSLNLVEMTGQDPEIGEQAFLGCEALNTVSLVGRWALGNKAFGDCPSLERFVLEDSHDIDRDAFKGSENVVVYTDSSWATGEAAKAGVKTTSTEE